VLGLFLHVVVGPASLHRLLPHCQNLTFAIPPPSFSHRTYLRHDRLPVMNYVVLPPSAIQTGFRNRPVPCYR